MEVVIVESPAKAKTINKYLGKNYEVYASYGHIRDLPSKDGSVDPDADFAMIWDVDVKSAKRMSDIAKAVKGSDGVILATDPDREGEAISWHVLEVLKNKKVLKDVKVSRVTFNAITKIRRHARRWQSRERSMRLLSTPISPVALWITSSASLCLPVLWRKLPGARSAGRVQSVTLRIICERELEIEKFVKREYWSLVRQAEDQRGQFRSPRASSAPMARSSAGSISATEVQRPRACETRRSPRRAAIPSPRMEAKPARRNPYAALHDLDHAAGGERASSAFRRTARCSSRSASTKVSTSAARRSVSSPICEPTASTWRPKPYTAPVASSARNSVTATFRKCTAQVHGQGEERAGSPRGGPPDRTGAAAEAGRTGHGA